MYWYIILYKYKSILYIGILYYININQFYLLVYYTINIYLFNVK